MARTPLPLVLTPGTTIDDVAMEFERATNTRKSDATDLLMSAARAGLALTEVAPGRTLLNIKGARAWAQVLESSIPLKLDPKALVEQLMEWMIERIQGGYGDKGVDMVIARGLKAIERRESGLGRELALEGLRWAIDFWDTLGRDDGYVLAETKSIVDAMIEAGADINAPILTPKSKRLVAYNQLDVLAKKEAKEGASNTPHLMMGHLIEKGANWEAVYYGPKTRKSTKQVLLRFPHVRSAALIDQAAEVARPKVGPRRKI